MNSSIELIDYAILKLQAEWRENTDGAKNTVVNKVHSSFDYDVFGIKDDSDVYRLDFSVKFNQAFNEKHLGYLIVAKISGFFKFPSGLSEKDKEMLVRLNGVSILYGILRGALGIITGVFPAGKVKIPAVLPQKIVEIVEKKKAEQAKKRTASTTQTATRAITTEVSMPSR